MGTNYHINKIFFISHAHAWQWVSQKEKMEAANEWKDLSPTADRIHLQWAPSTHISKETHTSLSFIPSTSSRTAAVAHCMWPAAWGPALLTGSQCGSHPPCAIMAVALLSNNTTISVLLMLSQLKLGQDGWCGWQLLGQQVVFSFISQTGASAAEIK